MRILHFNEYGPQTGGVEGYIAALIPALDGNGHKSHLVCFRPAGADEVPPSVSLALPGSETNVTYDALPVLQQIITDQRPDIAFIHVVQSPAVVDWIARRIPTVAYVHAPYVVCPGSGQYLRRSERTCPRAAGVACLVNAQLEKCCWGRNPYRHVKMLALVRAYVSAYARVSLILVGSRYMRRLLVRNGVPANKIAILPPVLLPEPLPDFTFPADSRMVLFAARLVPEKGLRHLIQALARISGPWRLLVAGAGEDQQQCQALAATLGLGQRVAFQGWLSEAEMSAAFRACACVAIPSLWPEPFGRIGPEAFAFGRPVVAYDSGGIGEWLRNGEFGYLVAPGDVVGLSDRLELLLASADLRLQMGLAARTKALCSWGASNHIGQLVRFLENAESL